MPDATFRHGAPVTIDYTPSAGDLAAGAMVLMGNTAGLTLVIPHVPITNNILGAVAAGGGVYDCMVASNYAAGSKVYKPTGNAILTTTSTNNALFGFTVEAAAAANAIVKVLHKPYV